MRNSEERMRIRTGRYLTMRIKFKNGEILTLRGASLDHALGLLAFNTAGAKTYSRYDVAEFL